MRPPARACERSAVIQLLRAKRTELRGSAAERQEPESAWSCCPGERARGCRCCCCCCSASAAASEPETTAEVGPSPGRERTASRALRSRCVLDSLSTSVCGCQKSEVLKNSPEKFYSTRGFQVQILTLKYKINRSSSITDLFLGEKS